MKWCHGSGTPLGVIVIGLALGTTAAACSRAAEVPTGQVEQAQRPALQESWDIVLNVSEAGVSRIRLTAWHMERYDDPDSVFTLFESNPDSANDRVEATFYDSTGVENASMTAESVRFDEEGELLVARGDVHVSAPSGRMLEAEVLHWDQPGRRIIVPGFVYLETEGEEIRGYDLEADEDLDNYVIRRITGTVVVKEDSE